MNLMNQLYNCTNRLRLTVLHSGGVLNTRLTFSVPSNGCLPILGLRHSLGPRGDTFVKVTPEIHPPNCNGFHSNETQYGGYTSYSGY